MTDLMWREFISGLTEHAIFTHGASTQQISNCEVKLKLQLPEQLRNLLAESNGAAGQYDLQLVWDVERIERDNITLRTDPDFADLYMPFDHLLFFADAGNGDQFAYPIQNGKIQRADIFVWDHETDERRWVAGFLQQYLKWWLDGTLTL